MILLLRLKNQHGEIPFELATNDKVKTLMEQFAIKRRDVNLFIFPMN
jgi:hypothetical protein